MQPTKKQKLEVMNSDTIPQDSNNNNKEDNEITFVNLTGHDINVYKDQTGNELIKTFPRDEFYRDKNVPVIEEDISESEPINGFPIVEKSFTRLVNMPEPKPKTIYIVGLLVAQFLIGTDRRDVIATDGGPTGSVRKDGRMIGVTRFIRFKIPSNNMNIDDDDIIEEVVEESDKKEPQPPPKNKQDETVIAL